MVGLLNTAVSGLKVSQTALKTTGHNIANANTEGYSRQRIDTATNTPIQYGVGFQGTGVHVTAIERVVDEFLVEQLRTDTSLESELSAFNENVRQLDTLLSNTSTGLADGMDRFFSVLENAADDPTSIPSRELVISEAENLANRFNTLYERISTVAENINSKMEVAVNQINSLAANIATMNNKIGEVGGTSQQTPNDLLDQREEMLRQLSELVDIDVVDQGNGLLNVSIGSGQALVVGAKARELDVVNGVQDPQIKDITYKDGQGSQVITQFVEGGELGGLVDFRESILSQSLNELGRVAMVLSDRFNEAHSLGIDLNNQFGGDFFRDVNDPLLTSRRVFSHNANAAPQDRVMTLELVDSSQLTASDYSLEVNDNDPLFRITRETDGAVVYSGTLPTSLPQSVEFDGLRLTFVQGSFQSSDTYLIQPTRKAASDIAVEIQRPDQLAFASPVLTEADGGNTGNGAITAGELISLTGEDGQLLGLFNEKAEMDPPLLVRFTSETTYEVLDNSDPSNPTDLDPPIRNRRFVPGQENPLFTSDPGETVIVASGTSLGIGTVSNGAAPLPVVANGYPSEIYSISQLDPDSGTLTSQVVTTAADASARAIASQLSDVAGVTAIARNEMAVSGFPSLTASAPLQITLNGENLVEYDGLVLDDSVPDPAADADQFNRYLADRINNNENLSGMGIRAVAATNAVSGQFELRVYSTEGDDFNLTLSAGGAETLTVTDYLGASQNLVGAGAGNQSTVTVGGTLDVILADGHELRSTPTNSAILGNSLATDFAKSSYLGIAASVNGVPDSGDMFTMDFNVDGISDNRNALELVSFSTAAIIADGSSSLGDAYGALVEVIGIETNASNINLEAATEVRAQTESLRDSVSGVNLDEEAANLIQFEQVYNANAQVISVARQLFDRLLNSF